MQGMETTGSMVLYIFPRMQENKCPLLFTATAFMEVMWRKRLITFWDI